MVSRWTPVCPSVYPSAVFRFRMITSEQQRIFTKCGLRIDIVEIWFGIADGQISSNFDGVNLPEKRPYFHFRIITWVNINGFSPNLICALIL